jgi:hypothetical protein
MADKHALVNWPHSIDCAIFSVTGRIYCSCLSERWPQDAPPVQRARAQTQRDELRALYAQRCCATCHYLRCATATAWSASWRLDVACRLPT